MGGEPVGECVDNRNTDAMETPGNLVAFLVELAACMENGQHHFKGALPVLLHPVDRNTPSVVFHLERAVFIDYYGNTAAITGKRFIDRVVHDFIDKMVQPAGVCAANIHGRTLTDRGESFKNGNMGCIVRFSQGKPPLKKIKKYGNEITIIIGRLMT
jgi:hypothetical protein